MSHEDNDANAKRRLVEADRKISLDPNDAAAHATRGTALSALERHEEAIAARERAAELAPDNPGAFVDLGYALLGNALVERALGAFDKAVSLDPSYPFSHLGRGRALLDMGRPAEALPAFDRAVEIDPNDSTGHDGRAEALVELGLPEEARKALSRSIEIEPDSAQSHTKMANLHCELHNPDKALVSCERAIGLDRFLAQAHGARARALRYLERYDDAMGACNHAVSLDPQNHSVLHVRGCIMFGLGKLDGALEDLDVACRLNTESEEMHAVRGHILRALGRHDEALEAYDRALSLEPAHLEALQGRVVVFLDRGDVASALSMCDALPDEHLDSPDACLHAGLVYHELGRDMEALEKLKKAATLDPGNMVSRLYALLILTHTELGDDGASPKLPTGEVRARPDDPGPHWSRATGLLAIGRHAEALPEIDMAIKAGPKVAAYRLAKGNVLAGLKRRARASAEHFVTLEALERDISRGGDVANAHIMRGDALRALGRVDKSNSAYRQAVRLNPDLGTLVYR